MNTKSRIIILSFIGVFTAVVIGFYVYKEPEDKNIATVEKTMAILNKIPRDQDIRIEYYSLDFAFRDVKELSSQDIAELKKIIHDNRRLEIHGSGEMGLEFKFSVKRREFSREVIEGYVFYHGMFTDCEKYIQLSRNDDFKYEPVADDIYKFSYTQQWRLLR